SLSPPAVDPTKNNFTLFCYLLRSSSSGSCPDKSFLWLNETGSELTGEGDGYKYGGQTGCVSSLTVNLQSSRRFTCQFVEGNKVKIEAHYGSEVSVCAVYRMETYRPLGEDVVLLCQLPQSDSHFGVKWRRGGETLVMDGTVMDAWAPGGRLSVNINGSLIIKKVRASDAGVYTCQFPTSVNVSVNALCLMSISPSPPDSECKKDKIMDLTCSLICNPVSCGEGSIVWLSGTGNVLQEKKVGQNLDSGCSSVLTPLNNRYTCQLIQGNRMKVEAHYSPLSTDETQTYSIYIIGVVLAVGLLLLLAAIAAVLINCRRRTKQSDEPKNSNSDVRNANNQIHQNAESPSTMTYASIGHFTPNSPLRVTVQQHEVTYSAVKPKMETDFDPNSLYSRVSKPE
ncbi:hypothetical protein CCH79_00000644, partial [Gambusia affinis]